MKNWAYEEGLHDQGDGEFYMEMVGQHSYKDTEVRTSRGAVGGRIGSMHGMGI